MDSFKAGELRQRDHYKSFEPAPINRKWQINDMEVLKLLSEADQKLGRLDMYSEYIPNLDLFITMHVVKEATQSSRIEGTRTNMKEALLDKEDVPLDKRDDWEEVQNYIKAMNSAIEELGRLPFSSRLIRNTHKTLMQGVRGERKEPGSFRTSQNWIGATLKDATFIPPAHTSVPDLMSDLEQFIHNDEIQLPELLKIALMHYQFETIHPFLDGNGRVGRLMITLYLVDTGILKKPILYLSDFFERNRTLYYDNLMRVREKNDLNQWFKFFLAGVIETATNSTNTFDAILRLQKEIDSQLQTLGLRANKANKVIKYLYTNPFITANKICDILSVTKPTSYKLIHDLEDLDILHEVTGSKRSRIYVFEKYLKLFTT